MVAAPREVFRGRTLLSVEPGNKVRCGHARVEQGGGLVHPEGPPLHDHEVRGIALEEGVGALRLHSSPC